MQSDIVKLFIGNRGTAIKVEIFKQYKLYCQIILEGPFRAIVTCIPIARKRLGKHISANNTRQQKDGHC
jgi:hypothetical protein